jgi:hypothetical protein
MKLMQTLGLAVLMVSSTVSFAAAPAAPAAGVITVGHVQAVTDLMAAMQAEKMMRTIAGTSHYASEAQRTATFAKLEKVPPAQTYARLAYPLARTISAETATEMARFYASSYGKKIVYGMYNNKVSYAGQTGPGGLAGPAPTAAERKDMQRPAFIKASKELAEAEGVIRHEGFVLLQSIAK